MTTAITEPRPERIKITLRSMYVAPPGKVLVAADLSQAESWIVAYSCAGAAVRDVRILHRPPVDVAGACSLLDAVRPL